MTLTRALLLVTDLGLALVLLLGGPARTSAPTFTTLRNTLPMPTWGAVLLALTVLAGVGLALRPRLLPTAATFALAVPFSLAAAWYAFWTAALTIAATQDARAALTGCVVYAAATVAHILCAARTDV